MSCGVSFMKFTLIFFNIIFLLIGLAGVGVGIWIAVDPNSLFGVLNYNPDASISLIQTSAYIFIGACAFILIVAAVGIFGACTGNRCLLGLYAFFVILIFTLELAALITVVVYDQKFRDELQTELAGQLKTSYKPNNEFAEAVDKFQLEFKCCGIANKSEYDSLLPDPILPSDSQWKVGKSYPNSCYATDAPDTVFPKGCYDTLRDKISTFAGAIIGIVVAVLVFELILFTFSICLCRHEDFGDKVV